MIEKYIVYAQFSTKGYHIPCLCKSIEKSEFLNSSLKLIGVQGMQDAAFPDLNMDEIHIRLENILYIAKATKELTEESAIEEILAQGKMNLEQAKTLNEQTAKTETPEIAQKQANKRRSKRKG